MYVRCHRWIVIDGRFVLQNAQTLRPPREQDEGILLVWFHTNNLKSSCCHEHGPSNLDDYFKNKKNTVYFPFQTVRPLFCFCFFNNTFNAYTHKKNI